MNTPISIEKYENYIQDVPAYQRKKKCVECRITFFKTWKYQDQCEECEAKAVDLANEIEDVESDIEEREAEEDFNNSEEIL